MPVRSLNVESSSGPADPAAGGAAIRFEDVVLAFDENVVLDGVSFELLSGRTKLIIGASGAGKSTILRLVLGLLKPDAGRIWVAGQRVDQLSERDLVSVRSRIGMVFQEGALFDSLTVRENVGYRLYEETRMPLEQVDTRVREVLGFVGLGEFIDRMPSELSGGQRRRVAIARALTSNPEIILYDEPTTGLDPITALTVDQEIVKLRDLQGTSALVVTHQLRDAFYIATHEATRNAGGVTLGPAVADQGERTEFLMLREGRVHFEGTAAELRATNDPYLLEFLS